MDNGTKRALEDMNRKIGLILEMLGSQVNNLCRDKFKFEYAVMGDGGGLAAINGAEGFAKIRTTVQQGYIAQFI